MIIQNKRIIASVLFVLISVGCMALGVDDPPMPSTPPGPPTPPLPIDGGLLVGAIVALFYGVKRIVSTKFN